MNKPRLWIFLTFSFISLFLFFYQLQQMATFDADQEFYAYEYVKAAKEGKLTLLGIPTSVGGLFVGPFYTYLATIIFFLFQGDPVGLHIVTLLILSFQSGLTYWLFTKISQRHAGIIAGILVLFSYVIWYKAYAPSPINFLYLFGLFFFYCLLKLKEDPRFLPYLALILGSAFHTHISLLFFFPIFFVYLLWQRNIKLSLRYYLLFFLIIAVFVSPLFLFELRHNLFLTSKLFDFTTQYVGQDQSYLRHLINVLRIAFEVFSGLLFRQLNKFVALFMIAVLLYFFVKLKENFYYQLGGLIFFVTIFILSLYQGHIPDYYYFHLSPLFFLVIADFLVFLARFRWLKLPVGFFIVFFILHNLTAIQAAVNPYNLFIKNQAIRYLKSQVGEKKVKVYLDADLGLQFGFGYLMDFYKLKRDDQEYQEIYQIILRQEKEVPGREFKQRQSLPGITVVNLDR